MSTRNRLIFTFLVCGYLFFLYAGISEAFPVLNLFSEGGWQGEGTGYLWELLGTFCWLGILPLIPDRYYQKNSRMLTAFLVIPILLLTLVSLIKALGQP